MSRPATSNDELGLGREHYATYLEAWSAALAMGSHFRLAYNGALFWDVTSTSPGGQAYSPMQETPVQTEQRERRPGGPQL